MSDTQLRAYGILNTAKERFHFVGKSFTKVEGVKSIQFGINCSLEKAFKLVGEIDFPYDVR